MIGARPHDYGSMADALGNARPYKNLTDWLDSDPDYRREHPDVVDAVVRDRELRTLGTVNLMRSAGPISDAYIFGFDAKMLLNGPGGSGKTTASCKKALVEAQRMRPGPGGKRRYVLGVWRNKYVNLWKATIPSWWKVFPKDLPASKWTGASPREAEHVVQFEDEAGLIELVARFRAFGETMDTDDVLGNEFTDVYLNEWNTLPDELEGALSDRVGRDPPHEFSGRPGRFFGDCNAPSVTEKIYKNFWEEPLPGHRLYRQPGGMDADAENIQAVGRAYYQRTIDNNQHEPWRIKRMVHNMPGYTRANAPVWKEFDPDRNIAKVTIPVLKERPVIVGIDGELNARAAYMQERGDGQLRILAETSREPGGVSALAERMLAIEASPRFAGCEFVDSCDPAMKAGEDSPGETSERGRLSESLGRRVELAPSQQPSERQEAIRVKIRHNCENGDPGLLIDPSCKTIIRGASETYHFRKIAGTDDYGSVAKTADGHTCEATEYGALLCGTAQAHRRKSALAADRAQRRDAARKAGRYDPLAKRRAR